MCLLSLLGCDGVRLFCCFVGVVMVTSGLRSELLDGVVWYGFSGEDNCDAGHISCLELKLRHGLVRNLHCYLSF